MDPTQLPLKDIHLPDAISWWPPAPGWWMLIGAAIILTVGVWVAYQRRSRPRRLSPTAFRRVVLRQWQQLRSEKLDRSSDTEGLRELSEFLRRAATNLHPGSAAAALTGESWLQYLDRFLGGNEFARGCGRLLITAPYQPSRHLAPHELQPCIDLCERWLHAALSKTGAR